MLIFEGQFYNSNFSNKINAPTFIYNIAYGKSPSVPLRGQTSHNKKNVLGIPIDTEIPTKPIMDLNKLKQIEMRSSCQGEDSKRPAFIIFRPINQDEEYIKLLINKLNKYTDISAGYDKGNMGKFRIGITNKNMYPGQSGYEDWWKTLPIKIKKSL